MDEKDLIHVISPACPRCKKVTETVVTRAGLEAWQNGALIQQAFPDMSAADREVLLTGYHQMCWQIDIKEGAEKEDWEPIA